MLKGPVELLPDCITRLAQATPMLLPWLVAWDVCDGAFVL